MKIKYFSKNFKTFKVILMYINRLLSKILKRYFYLYKICYIYLLINIFNYFNF